MFFFLLDLTFIMLVNITRFSLCFNCPVLSPFLIFIYQSRFQRSSLSDLLSKKNGALEKTAYLARCLQPPMLCFNYLLKVMLCWNLQTFGRGQKQSAEATPGQGVLSPSFERWEGGVGAPRDTTRGSVPEQRVSAQTFWKVEQRARVHWQAGGTYFCSKTLAEWIFHNMGPLMFIWFDEACF